MHATAKLADHLDDRNEAILSLWHHAVQRGGDVPVANRLSPNDFLDDIPALLDRLADRLRGQPGDPTDAAQKHGWIRWRQGYDIAEVVNELGHLRTALLQATFEYVRSHRCDTTTIEMLIGIINEVLDDATAEAVGQFQESSAAEVRRALEQVEERKQAVEDACRIAEGERAKLRTILDSLPVGVWVADAEGTVIHANREAGRIQGFPVEEAIDRVNVYRIGSEYQLFRPDGSPYPPAELPLARGLRGEFVPMEEIIWPLNGRFRTIAANAAPLSDASGTIIGGVVVVHDISDRKEVEEQLRHQFEFTSTITSTMGEGVYVIDRQARVTYVNPAAARMLGWDAAELLGQNMHQAIHYQRPDGTPFPAEECPLWGALQSREPLSGDDVFIRRDGSMFPVAFMLSPIDGTGAGAVMTFSDITERKRLEAVLATAEARLRSIVEQSPVMIWRADPAGACDYFNQTWYDFRGRASDQELGQGWTEGVHPDDLPGWQATFRDAFARRETFEITFRLLRRDGQYRWIHERCTPYYDGQAAFLGFLGSCVDITERVELETVLQQQRQLAEEASRHKTRLLSALSHDARTPLNAVVLSVQLLEMHHQGNVDPEIEQCLRTIRHSVRNVLDLLGDLLNLTKIDAGALPAELSRFELEPVLTESMASIEAQARIKGLGICIDPNGLAGAVLESDRAKLKQVLCNLLSNALRYTERGHIRIVCARTADQFSISVEDTGVGIAPADQNRIFDEFATLDNPHRPANEGTGLGLAICRRLASLLRGEITLESEPDRGSTFTLVLPASALTATPTEESAPRVTSAEPVVSGAVLVAEDHLTSRQTLAKVLSRMGYRVLEAGNGRDALALIRQERPMAILMDINMPIMDGIETAAILRADPRTCDIPIFALTGDVSLINQRRIGEVGVDGYLEKPVTWEALKNALASLQDRSRPAG